MSDELLEKIEKLRRMAIKTVNRVTNAESVTYVDVRDQLLLDILDELARRGNGIPEWVAKMLDDMRDYYDRHKGTK